MKKYQLIGRKKLFVRSSSKSIKVDYPPQHICSLPLEILMDIFEYCGDPSVVNYLQTMLNLSLTCKKFHGIINRSFLYNHVIFPSHRSFKSFAVDHLVIDNTSNKLNFIKFIEFINPMIKGNSNFEIKIAGSYSIDAESSFDNWNFEDYLSCFNHLLSHSFGLKVLVMSEIAPEFAFPVDGISSPVPTSSSSNTTSSSLSSFWSKKKTIISNNRTIEKVILKTQSGWSIPFKLSHISTILVNFDDIQELELSNFIIDDFKIISDLSNAIKPINIHKLTLNSCLYANTFKKKFKTKKLTSSIMFDNVKILQLNHILSGNDLSIIDFIKLNNKLDTLILDLNSSIFYNPDPTLKSKVFHYSKYNKFFKLLCSGVGGYSRLSNLTLSNFDLVDCFDHSNSHKSNNQNPANIMDDDQAENNLESLLKFLGYIKNLTIILSKECSVRKVKTCVKCGFSTSSTNDLSVEDLNHSNWSKLLKPLITSNEGKCIVKVFNYKLDTLFIRDNDDDTI
ncbi:hypothetical protein DFJ63DRAFT_37713 [Scheffersomyces coipomensis]|uniref:uncharacterized protein n=1 Tax=Scheffersomyces coipomensis TaxID=1788519 RepID=UPI00315C859F